MARWQPDDQRDRRSAAGHQAGQGEHDVRGGAECVLRRAGRRGRLTRHRGLPMGRTKAQLHRSDAVRPASYSSDFNRSSKLCPIAKFAARSSALHKLPSAALGATVEVWLSTRRPPGRPDHDLTNAVFIDPPLVSDSAGARLALDYALISAIACARTDTAAFFGLRRRRPPPPGPAIHAWRFRDAFRPAKTLPALALAIASRPSPTATKRPLRRAWPSLNLFPGPFRSPAHAFPRVALCPLRSGSSQTEP